MNTPYIKDFLQYATLILHYYPVLTRYAGTMVPFSEEASAIAADVMISMWKERISIDSKRSLRKYLRQTTRYYCMEWISEAIRTKTNSKP